jgi:uncharacterized membrane protein
MRRRRVMVGLSLFNIASMSLIGLFQMGLLRRVPEPPLPGFDADKVNGSAQAYEILQTPDALLATITYGATASLAAMGPPDRHRSASWIPLALAIKAFGDAAFAVKLLIDQPTRYKAFCLWCVLAAGSTLAVAGLSVPEAVEAWKTRR